MKKIYNDIIPFKGYKALTLWPWIFIRNGAKARFNERTERHENTHGEQQKELLAVGTILCAVLMLSGCGWWSLMALPLFLWLYGLFYLIGLVRYHDHDRAYYNNPFEQEAYRNQENLQYLENRHLFAWVKYIGKIYY